MTTKRSDCRSTRHLDRLSLLPNELLDAIFDDAYSSSPPSAPLSKRLYPFFERRVHRDVFLRSTASFHAFSHTLDLKPDRGQLVSTLAVCSSWRPRDDPTRLSLDKLLSKLPNLVSLDLPVGPNRYLEPLPETMSRLARITSVSADIHDSYDSLFRLSDLAPLSALATLDELNVFNYPEWILDEDLEWQGTKLRSVATLRVEGDGADQQSVRRLVDLCPEVRNFELHATGRREAQYDLILPILPATLHSLRIDPTNDDYVICDPFLPRFSQLHTLDLGPLCYSEDLPTVLAQLPSLVQVRLVGGFDDFQGLASLVSGPSRLVNLGSITLDTEFATDELAGSRTLPPSHPSFPSSDAERDMSDWRDPSHDLEDQDEFDNLCRVCEANGVSLEGTVVAARALVKDYYLEAMNRAVVYAWISRGDDDSLLALRDAREDAEYVGLPVPVLDIGSLDRDHLAVFEFALPEQDWYVLSLTDEVATEGGSQSESDDDEEEEEGREIGVDRE